MMRRYGVLRRGQICKSLRIQSTAKPNSNLSSTIVGPRFSAAMTARRPSISLRSPSLRPGRRVAAKFNPSARDWTRPTMRDLIHHLCKLACTDRPHQRHRTSVRHTSQAGLFRTPRRRRPPLPSGCLFRRQPVRLKRAHRENYRPRRADLVELARDISRYR